MGPKDIPETLGYLALYAGSAGAIILFIKNVIHPRPNDLSDQGFQEYLKNGGISDFVNPKDSSMNPKRIGFFRRLEILAFGEESKEPDEDDSHAYEDENDQKSYENVKPAEVSQPEEKKIFGTLDDAVDSGGTVRLNAYVLDYQSTPVGYTGQIIDEARSVVPFFVGKDEYKPNDYAIIADVLRDSRDRRIPIELCVVPYEGLPLQMFIAEFHGNLFGRAIDVYSIPDEED